MAKTEKIRNTQVVDNKEDKFFYFPMVSMGCTGSGYQIIMISPCKLITYEGFLFLYCNIAETFLIFRFEIYSFIKLYNVKIGCVDID